MKQLVLDPAELPIRFSLGNEDYRGMPKGCTANKNGSKITYTSVIGDVEVRAECVSYDDFDASEWTVYFTNKGDHPTQRLRCLFPIDFEFRGEEPLVYTCNGDYNSPDGYSTAETRLPVGAWIKQEPYGGRPCYRAFPYHRIQFNGKGHNIAIGWPGEWEAEFRATEDGINYKAGQKQSIGDNPFFDLEILPGETIRTPLIAVVSYDGDVERGINVWRRWFIKYVGIEKPMVIANYVPPNTIECSATTEENQLKHIKKAKDIGLEPDIWWIDAGWYKCKLKDGTVDWWATAGDWDHDEERYPNGLTPIGEECEKQGIKFLLWFEPERVVPESRVVSEHPEWILTHDWYNGLKILDMSQPDCCDYLIKKIGDLIEKYRVKIYRQDYNLDEPLRLWKNKDVDGRYGATENLYVQGYLRFWDALLERFPGLVIDSCASGGSRNDIETLRRAVVLHQSDYGYGNHPIQQSFSQTLYSWIPYFRGFGEMDEREDGTYGTDAPMKNLPIDDEFNVLHSFAPITSVFAKFVRQDCTEEQYAKMREYRKLYDEIAPTLCTGDFYALTPYHKSRKKWTVWQFDTPENDCGIIEVIRNNAAQDDVLSVLPRLKSGKYIFKNMISGEQKVYSGGTIEFDQPLRSITFWKYVKTE